MMMPTDAPLSGVFYISRPSLCCMWPKGSFILSDIITPTTSIYSGAHLLTIHTITYDSKILDSQQYNACSYFHVIHSY